ncbi:MAG TPA: hypothetical protein VID19_02485 [Candidatus Eremiobacteraceae bacterium]|jgi:hypothetical protein
MDRKQFVVASGVSAFAALAWLRGIARGSALAATPDAAESAQQVALGVVQAILPFEDHRFPAMSPEDVRKRMYSIFSLDDDAAFESSLALFDTIVLWANPPLPVIALEVLRYGQPDVARDQRLFEKTFTDRKVAQARFVDLGVDDKRLYLAMWSQSSFGVRRRVYQSFKALVHATAYSMDALWNAIGYDGPLVSKGITS